MNSYLLWLEDLSALNQFRHHNCNNIYQQPKGDAKSIECHKIAKNIWDWVINRSIHLSAKHIPGSKNVLADKGSKVFNENTLQALESCP